MINTELFKEDWQKIECLLDQIRNIPKEDQGEDLEGYLIDSDGITCKTSTYYSGCGTDYYSWSVFWEEINNPIEYFEKYYADQKIAREKRKIEGITYPSWTTGFEHCMKTGHPARAALGESPTASVAASLRRLVFRRIRVLE